MHTYLSICLFMALLEHRMYAWHCWRCLLQRLLLVLHHLGPNRPMFRTRPKYIKIGQPSKYHQFFSRSVYSEAQQGSRRCTQPLRSCAIRCGPEELDQLLTSLLLQCHIKQALTSHVMMLMLSRMMMMLALLSGKFQQIVISRMLNIYIASRGSWGYVGFRLWCWSST